MPGATEAQDSLGNENAVEVVKILCAGLNAHGQLVDQHKDDSRTFHSEGPYSTSPEIFFSGWSTTAILHHDHLILRGHQSLQIPLDTSKPKLRCGFGDHNGLIGCLDTEGGLHLLSGTTSPDQQSTALERHGDDDSPPLSHVALAGNGKLAVTFKQAPNARLTHVVEFNELDGFLKWHSDPSASYPAQHHMLPGKPKQLLAGTGTFLMLMEGSEVYTWGDPRYRSLGRSTTGEGATPADKPGLVEALGGLKVEKIACGGWLNAAVTTEMALYIWGSGTPGTDRKIKCLDEAGAGEVVLVDMSQDDNDRFQDFVDVVDVGVGDNHIAAITEGGRMFVVGDNRNGQLGLGQDETFFESWTPVEILSGVRSVVCGPKATFAIVAESSD